MGGADAAAAGAADAVAALPAFSQTVPVQPAAVGEQHRHPRSDRRGAVDPVPGIDALDDAARGGLDQQQAQCSGFGHYHKGWSSGLPLSETWLVRLCHLGVPFPSLVFKLKELDCHRGPIGIQIGKGLVFRNPTSVDLVRKH